MSGGVYGAGLVIALKSLREVLGSMLRLRPYLRGGRRLYALVIGTALLAATLEASALALLGGVVFMIINPAQADLPRSVAWLQDRLGSGERTTLLLALAACALGTMAAKNVVLYLSTRLSGMLKRRVTINLRRGLFQRLQSAHLRFFEETKAGEITSVFLNDTARAFTTLETVLFATQRGSMALAYLGVLLLLSWSLTLVALGFAALVAFPVLRVHRRIRDYGTTVAGEMRELAAQLTESFAGIRVVRATNAQEQQLGKVDARNAKQAIADERYIRLSGAVLPTMETLAAAAGLGILLAASGMVQRGAMPAEQLMTFGLVLMRLLPLVNQLNSLQATLIYQGTSLVALEKWFSLPVYPERPFGSRTFEGVREGIVFEDVGLTYETGKVALKGVSFRVPAGRMVALVGASGSGKSTAASLLLRLRAPTSGRILVDGIDVWEFTPASWHARVAIVEQEAFLFNDTVEANVAFGAPAATRADVEDALRQAHLAEVVRNLPGGLESQVGERGTTLSGGQRQRMAIARALVRRPQVLILDEATSALDTISERQVQAAIETATQDRTVVVIAHRLSTIRNADHIVVLDGGEVAEQGSWADLMARGEAFARLVRTSEAGRETTGIA
ncbi:MAG: ABC transporter ATP-binding protein [Limisphaerales bacterium]